MWLPRPTGLPFKINPCHKGHLNMLGRGLPSFACKIFTCSPTQTDKHMQIQLGPNLVYRLAQSFYFLQNLCFKVWFKDGVKNIFHVLRYKMTGYMDGITLSLTPFSLSLSRAACTCFHFHPSIHFLYSLNPSVGSGWSLSPRSSGERRGTPCTDRQFITGPHRDKRDKQPHTLTLTPKDNFRVTN